MKRYVLFAVAPAVVLLAMCGWFQTRNSVTVDETFYLTAAKQIFRHGRFAEASGAGTAPLPLLLAYGPAVAARGDLISDREWHATDDDPGTVAVARWTHAIAVGVPLVVLVVGWVYRRTGRAWAAVAAGLFAALSPAVVAHSSLATTDAAFTLFYLLALAAAARHAAVPTAGRLLAAGAAVGLAVAAKYGAVLLFPVAFLLGVMADWTAADRPPFGRRVLRLLTAHPARQAGLAAVAFLTCWATTGFELHHKPLSARADVLRKVFGQGTVGDAVVGAVGRVRLPSPVVGLMNQVTATGETAPRYPTHLLGRFYPRGHRLYYAIGLTAKSTPAELTLLAVATVAGGVLGLLCRRGPVDLPAAALVLGVGMLLLVCSLAAKQFGVRYVLPVYPAAIILGVSGLAAGAGRWRAAAVAGLVIWQAASVPATGPRPLSHVHGLFGGPDRGHELLGNSDVDWGQGLIDLRDFLAARGETVVLARTTGSTPVTAYGVRPADWQPDPPCRYIAIGATRLNSNLDYEPDLIPFRTVRPTHLVGYSIYVYDTADPDVLAAYRAAVAARTTPHSPPPP